MAEAPIHLPSGHDEEFVNEVEDDFLCLICQLPLKEPVLTRCGHRFCKKCLEEYLGRQEVLGQCCTCPADREVLDQIRDVFPDKATERKILSLAITCPSEGCVWSGELRSKENHLTTCVDKVVCCTIENCLVKVKRKDLEEHMTITCKWRIIMCGYCREPHLKCQMQDHKGKCKKFPVNCSNNCGLSIPREMIPNHIANQCPLTFIACPYFHIDCDEKVQRKNVQSHLETAMLVHLDLACARLNETHVQLRKTQVELKTSQEELRKLAEKVATKKFVWKIDEFSEVIRKAKAGEQRRIESVPFYTESHGYQVKIGLFPNGNGTGEDNYLSVFIVSMKGEYDAILPWPWSGRVKFTLIDQQENVNQLNPGNLVHYWQHLLCEFARPENNVTEIIGIDKFMSHLELLTRRYLVDNTVFLQVEISPP